MSQNVELNQTEKEWAHQKGLCKNEVLRRCDVESAAKEWEKIRDIVKV